MASWFLQALIVWNRLNPSMTTRVFPSCKTVTSSFWTASPEWLMWAHLSKVEHFISITGVSWKSWEKSWLPFCWIVRVTGTKTFTNCYVIFNELYYAIINNNIWDNLRPVSSLLRFIRRVGVKYAWRSTLAWRLNFAQRHFFMNN